MFRVATIIAHWNYNNYLGDAIKSCLDQTYKNYICVIDDNSEVSPLEIMKSVLGEPIKKYNKFYFGDKAVLITNEKTMGPSFSRNVGIKECNEFNAYAILDADDWMLPDKIQEMALVMQDGNIGVVYADYHIINSDGVSKMEFKHPYDAFLLQQNCIVHSGSMISAKFLNMVKLGDNEWYNNELRVAEDYNLWLRLSKVCMFQHIPKFLTVVRDHELNSTNTVSAEIWQNNLIKAKQ